MIKFQHSIFALPFAVMSAFIAARGIPAAEKLLWILVAMVSARSAAMAFNRIADAKLDAINPRTKDRAIPAGRISVAFTALFTLSCAAIFVFAAYKLNELTFILSPLALFIILFYSFTKRFTMLSHLFLGLSLGIAPVGTWIAITGSFAIIPIILAAGVTLWTAGFDIIYACQDVEFDRQHALHSVPKTFGIPAALNISIALHVLALVAFISLFFSAGMGIPYAAGCAITGILLVYEHHIVSPGNLEKINIAFFNVNAIVSVTLMATAITDVFLGKA